MGKRTSQTGIPNWEDAQDLNALVQDKRSGKRANSAKGRRRNRRYENRLISAQLEQADLDDADPLELEYSEALDTELPDPNHEVQP
ncbi:MAG: hypothetical protein AAFY17_08735 [Cyanobacteria bacterium J06642_11]